MSKRQGSSPGSKSLPGIHCAGGSWAEHRSETEEHRVAGVRKRARARSEEASKEEWKREKKSGGGRQEEG
jgi:hypothetical protein